MRVRYGGYQGFGLSPILVLITINLLVFIILAVVPSLRPLLWLRPAGFLSQPWTIVTSMFVHAGFWHIFANMVTLFFFGSSLSRLVGNNKCLLIYFAGGILGNICYIVVTFVGGISGISFLGSPFIAVAGASGAIFALAGALVVMRPRLPVMIFPIPLPVPLWIAVIGGFLILSFMPSVAWQAHLGGLIFGLIFGYIFTRSGKSSFF